MKRTSYKIGIDAEQIVEQHFISLGYNALKRRYKTPFGEIDLIMLRGNEIAFIEVKARKYQDHGEYITRRQVKRNAAAIEFFLAQHSEFALYEYQFPLVVVNSNCKICEIVDCYINS